MMDPKRKRLEFLCKFVNHGVLTIVNLKFWSERLRETVRKKFDFDLDFQDYIGIHRPAIFLSMQYHVRRYKR